MSKLLNSIRLLNCIYLSQKAKHKFTICKYTKNSISLLKFLYLKKIISNYFFVSKNYVKIFFCYDFYNFHNDIYWFYKPSLKLFYTNNMLIKLSLKFSYFYILTDIGIISNKDSFILKKGGIPLFYFY